MPPTSLCESCGCRGEQNDILRNWSCSYLAGCESTFFDLGLVPSQHRVRLENCEMIFIECNSQQIYGGILQDVSSCCSSSHFISRIRLTDLVGKMFYLLE